MTLQNPSTGLGQDRGRRWRLLNLLRRLRTAQARVPYGPAGPAGSRDRRHLAALDRRLAAEAPALASMYGMFNRLTKDEGPSGWEALTVAPPRRARPHPAQLAVLMVLAAVAALCVTLSTQLHPGGVPGCNPAVSAAAVAAAPSVHSAACASYATNK
jgi:hypothetical protein